MTWEPLSETELHGMLNSAWERMSLPQRRFWEAIRIEPQKWELPPYGDLGGGFWVVAVIGQTVVWYNDIEDGFNRSHYSTPGTIGEYWCNQDRLEWTIQNIINTIDGSFKIQPHLAPPQPI
jgi:hypothetical protein